MADRYLRRTRPGPAAVTLGAMTVLSASQTTARRSLLRFAAPLLGLAAGVLTSYAQGWLPAPWAALANSASPWLVVAFLVGCLQRSLPAAAVLGALTCLGEVAGYYGASAARDFGISDNWVAFWVVCALVGGPVFGACGQLARGSGSRAAAAVGAAAPAATFLGEGIGSYWLRLGYHQDAALYVALGVAAAVLALALIPLRALTLMTVCGGTLGAAFAYGVVFRVLG